MRHYERMCITGIKLFVAPGWLYRPIHGRRNLGTGTKNVTATESLFEVIIESLLAFGPIDQLTNGGSWYRNNVSDGVEVVLTS
mmetsp:Transcript_17224/g.35378  ORF Transcript_17224/g.35378 Transcript_17224/m.35378 type:complete len:83 (+) Transcript_17224:1211-1459(+)